MHMFEVVNDNNKVVLDDTQTCLHLKYLLKYSKIAYLESMCQALRVGRLTLKRIIFMHKTHIQEMGI